MLLWTVFSVCLGLALLSLTLLITAYRTKDPPRVWVKTTGTITSFHTDSELDHFTYLDFFGPENRICQGKISGHPEGRTEGDSICVFYDKFRPGVVISDTNSPPMGIKRNLMLFFGIPGFLLFGAVASVVLLVDLRMDYLIDPVVECLITHNTRSTYATLAPSLKPQISPEKFDLWVKAAQVSHLWKVNCGWTMDDGRAYSKATVFRNGTIVPLEVWWEGPALARRIVAIRISKRDTLGETPGWGACDP